MKLIYRIGAVVALIALLCAGAQAKSFVTIGSGSTTGLYYPTAVGIAKIITESDIAVGANARSTGGSAYNAIMPSTAPASKPLRTSPPRICAGWRRYIRK